MKSDINLSIEITSCYGDWESALGNVLNCRNILFCS